MLVFINYKRNAEPDHELAVKTEAFLRNEGYEVFRDESRLRGGEDWSHEILNNLTKAKCMLCFVSNASMKSRWVINEIEEAINLNKPLIPIKIEEVDGELNFAMYRPYFLTTQRIQYSGDFAKLSKDILASLKKMRPEHRLRHIVPYRKIVSAALAKHGFDDTVDIMCWFLEFLQDFHIVIAAGAELDPMRCVPKWAGPGGLKLCRSASEALVDAVNQYVFMYRHNFENGKKSGGKYNWWWEERLKCSDCFAEILNKVMSEWQPHVERVKAEVMARRQEE